MSETVEKAPLTDDELRRIREAAGRPVGAYEQAEIEFIIAEREAKARYFASSAPFRPSRESPVMADNAESDASGPGAAVQEISALIDGTYRPDLDREAWAWRRVMKVAEEVGEVNEAMLGWLGENPRKGITHTSEDVVKELLDVALAALGACAHLDGDSDPIEALIDHAHWVRDRLRTAIADRAISSE